MNSSHKKPISHDYNLLVALVMSVNVILAIVLVGLVYNLTLVRQANRELIFMLTKNEAKDSQQIQNFEAEELDIIE